MSLAATIKANPFIKKAALWLLIPVNDFRPRLWIRLFVNPFKHKKGKGSIIRNQTRMDVFPFNKFELGDRSLIESFSTINNGVGDVFIGNKSLVGIGCTVIGPVVIGNNVIMAQNIVVSGLNHGYEIIDIPPCDQKTITSQITISDDVWIGANCVVTAGVTIGKHAVIGAGSIVTKNVPPYSVSVGNPARVVKLYNFENNKWERV
ncbi:Acetyltransferase (isoleucine patch superfamily) [Pedobacter westerhofensis]|jgi:acetyltransferase-like isoleucine patch superfamily enzyme|uniref:Acetyltransferase (Isoleucine patch superfamily) n=1 Tax=Pedobacter westerhofensis TaxID=425512 RepID=A0A521E7U0_9SPHI|nr:acyltransferase [Pedobacter westerhofensis]SMO79491.1 Acetyltransferase (isoleucine patch superfamily) [Pedobacter westerhofensis]